MPTTDTGTARYIGKRILAAYLTVPVYAAFHQWLGRGDIIAPMLAAWNSGDRKGALDAIPDSLVDELVIHGRCRGVPGARGRLSATGLDTPVMAVMVAPGVILPRRLPSSRQPDMPAGPARTGGLEERQP